MKSRRIVEAQSLRDVDVLLARPQFQKVLEQLAAHHRDPALPEPPLGGLGEDVLEAVTRLALRQSKRPFDEKSFSRAMKRTQPLAAQPRRTHEALDAWYALAQPEVSEDFWPAWSPRTGSRGPNPGYVGKALLTCAARLGHSAHLDSNYEHLMRSRPLQAVFAWLEAVGATAAGIRARPFGTTGYEATLRNMHAVAEHVTTDRCIETNIELCRRLHGLLGIERVRLVIDGMLLPAWCKQAGSRSPEEERTIRRVAHGATFKALTGKDGKPVRTLRGYQLFALVVVETGAPLVWEIRPATDDEPKALASLLQTLFYHWPDLRVECIAADAAWDEEAPNETCLTRYGIPLIARRHGSMLDHAYPLKPFDSESIARFFGDGRAVCRQHGVIMVRNGFSKPRRERDGQALRPGERSSRSAFRARYQCPTSAACGRPGLRVDRNWASLAYHPHSLAAGEPDLHAFREAMLVRRNTVESLFSGLQVGTKLGTDGADRTHTPREATVMALFNLALMLRTSFQLASIRIDRGEFPERPPNELADALGLA